MRFETQHEYDVIIKWKFWNKVRWCEMKWNEISSKVKWEWNNEMKMK